MAALLANVTFWTVTFAVLLTNSAPPAPSPPPPPPAPVPPLPPTALALLIVRFLIVTVPLSTKKTAFEFWPLIVSPWTAAPLIVRLHSIGGRLPIRLIVMPESEGLKLMVLTLLGLASALALAALIAALRVPAAPVPSSVIAVTVNCAARCQPTGRTDDQRQPDSHADAITPGQRRARARSSSWQRMQ